MASFAGSTRAEVSQDAMPRSGQPVRRGRSPFGDIAGPQIDLGRTAGTLDDHQVSLGMQRAETVQHRLHEGGLWALVAAGAPGSRHAAAHHQLSFDVAPGLQEYWVHIDGGGRAADDRLQCLRPADLATISGDRPWRVMSIERRAWLHS